MGKDAERDAACRGREKEERVERKEREKEKEVETRTCGAPHVDSIGLITSTKIILKTIE